MGYAPPVPDLMAPARKASVAMFILAGLCIMMGVCSGLAVAVPKEQLKLMIDAQQLKKNMPPMQLPAGWELEDIFHVMYAVVAIAGVVLGIIVLALGVLVRRANKVAAVFAAIICGLLALLMGLLTVNDLIMAVTGNPIAIIGICVGIIPFALFGLITLWLMQLLKSLPQIEAARRQWAAYNAAAQQQQQAYGQPYGYGYPTAPQPGYGQPPGGYAHPPAGAPPVGYGTLPPPPAQGGESGPPVRHPPLPPDQQNPPG
jgi:hypothetical protein